MHFFSFQKKIEKICTCQANVTAVCVYYISIHSKFLILARILFSINIYKTGFNLMTQTLLVYNAVGFEGLQLCCHCFIYFVCDNLFNF